MNDPRIANLYGEVNYIPAWYEQARCRRCLRKRMVLLNVLVALLLAGWTVQLWRNVGALQLNRDAVFQQVDSTRRQAEEIARLKLERTKLNEQLKVHRELRLPINYSQVTGTLAALTPEGVALRELDVQNETVTVTRRVPVAQSDNKTPGPNASKNKPKVERISRPLIVVQVEGLAPSNVAIADYIGRLASSRLFANVKMLYSREGRKGRLITRQFRLRMEVPLERDYRFIAPDETQEVADAL